VDLLVVDNGTFSSQSDPGGIFVFPGVGNGTFQNPTRYEAGINPVTIAVDDLNADGRLDIAVTTTGPSFAFLWGVLLGSGGGAFQPAVLHETEFGPNHVVIADFTHDSKPDLLVAYCCGETDLALIPGNGDGTFQSEEHFPGGADPIRVATADFNADGLLDLAVANGGGSLAGGVSVFLDLSGGGPPAGALASVSAASFQPGGSVAPVSIVAGFGSGLATGTAGATSFDLPTDLLGTMLRVRDALGTERLAPLFFVSAGQVNYLMPAGTASGLATTTLTAGSGNVVTGTVEIATVAPGLFKATTDGVAVGNAFRLRPGSPPSEQSLTQDVGGQIVPRPIDMGAETDTVVLVLYGTGIRFRQPNGVVTATIGGVNASVTYAGDQGTFIGLDQINIEIPRSLRGRGLVEVVLTVDGKITNALKIHVQ
jgi:uncharacterized protein (TIGR03437 family)